ncbi:MAG: hypothetical protein IPJ79_06240 [Bacteroidetes bacterium]|nr:hypothetical protein [Bacteroidota bacterium]
MKKLFTLVLFLAFINSSPAQEVWQMYPIQVNQVQLNLQDSYFVYSCYDSILQVTVVDSTPVYQGSIYSNVNGGLFYYATNISSETHIIAYDINNHAFVKDSIDNGNCPDFGNILGNSVQFYSCGIIQSNERENLLYYDVVNNTFDLYTYSYNSGWGFLASFSNGWFYDFKGGDPLVQIQDARSFDCVQKGMFGHSGFIYNDQGGVGDADGILVTINGDRVSFLSNDSCKIAGVSNNVAYETGNGIAYASDSIKTYLFANDPWINQWTRDSLPHSFNLAHSLAVVRDRIITFAVNKDTVANVYCAAYNIHTHQWVIDSVQSNRVSSLNIINGTVTWLDSSGTSFTRGYSDSLGWGNFNTPLDIDFYVENYQSPTNGNLVYVRNMTIGTDSTTIDWGDGVTTPLKSQSHLYKNPNGTYRTPSTTFSYDICIYALGQSNCKTVTFNNTVGTTDLTPSKN